MKCMLVVADVVLVMAIWPATGAALPRPHDGADPVATGCLRDATVVDTTPLIRGAVRFGSVELRYSAFCDAGWATIQPKPGLAATWAYVSVQAADGTATSLTGTVVGTTPLSTDIIAPHGGCLAASAVMAPGTPTQAGGMTRCAPVHSHQEAREP
jgi:hypothetical protein